MDWWIIGLMDGAVGISFALLSLLHVIGRNDMVANMKVGDMRGYLTILRHILFLHGLLIAAVCLLIDFAWHRTRPEWSLERSLRIAIVSGILSSVVFAWRAWRQQQYQPEPIKAQEPGPSPREKICPYCGKRYAGSAEVCSLDRQELVAAEQDCTD